MKKQLWVIKDKDKGLSLVEFAVIMALLLCVIGTVMFLLYPKIQKRFNPANFVIAELESKQIAGIGEVLYRQLTEQEIDRMYLDGKIGFWKAREYKKEGLWAFSYRFCLTDGSQRCIPADGGYNTVSPDQPIDSSGTFVDETCGKAVTFTIITTTVSPTISAAEAGTKTDIHFDGIRPVGDGNCELGDIKRFEDESKFFDFGRDILGQSVEEIIRNLPECTIRVWSGGDYTVESCTQRQWTKLVTRTTIGPAPNPLNPNISFFVIAATDGNINMFSPMDYPELAGLQGYLNEPNETRLSNDALREMRDYLIQQASHFFVRAK